MNTPSDFIGVYEDALSGEFCEQLIRRFDASKDSTPGMTAAGYNPTSKLSTDLTLDLYDEWRAPLNELHRQVGAAILDYVGRTRFPLIGTVAPQVVDPNTGESVLVSPENWDHLDGSFGGGLTEFLLRMAFCYDQTNIQKYDQGMGGYPLWHSEIFPGGIDNPGLHRVLFWLAYLNDVEEGGETEFYFQQRKVKPRRGTIIIAPAGFTHTHRGNTPISGDKYVATSWIRFKNAEEIYGKTVTSDQAL